MSDVCDASVTDSRNCDRKVKFKKLKIRKYKRYIHVIFTEKPRPDGLALVFQERKPGQSRHEAVKMARPGSQPRYKTWFPYQSGRSSHFPGSCEEGIYTSAEAAFFFSAI